MSTDETVKSSGTDTLLRALLIAALAFAALCGLLLSILFPLVGLILFGLVMMVGSVIYSLIRWRESRRQSTLWALALAAEQGIPLSGTLESLAGDDIGEYSQKLRRLARLMDAGAPLPDAINLTPGVLPRGTALFIRGGWEANRLAPALRETAAGVALRRPLQFMVGARLSYFLFLFVAIQVISWFLLYFIMPKFEAIFFDFGVDLPAVTVFVVRASHFAASAQGAPFLLLAIVAEAFLLMLVPLALARGWQDGIPILDRFFPSRHGAKILRFLAWVVEAERPLSGGVASLARYYPSRWVRGRLELVLEDLVRGVPCWEALEKRKLIRPADHTLLDSADRVGNLGWAMRQLADANERRFEYRLRIGLHAVSDVVVLVLGGVALLIAVAYFSPLVTLLTKLGDIPVK